jgi:hypothetical protein
MKPEPRTAPARPSIDIGRTQTSSITTTKNAGSQQRVFVGNSQQFNMVEIGPSTTAGDVVSMMEAEGALVGWAGTGGWMVFEVVQDFGMGICKPFYSMHLIFMEISLAFRASDSILRATF